MLVLAVIAFGYFGSIELQSYWGRQAVAKTGLEAYGLQEAFLKAKKENKSVFVDVSAIWCGTCRRLDNEVFANRAVKEVLNENYVFVRLEYETAEGQRFIKERDVTGFPNLWILNSDGQNIRRLRVTFDPADFIAQIE